MATVSIVILNWNGKQFLEQFLTSVVQHSSFEWANIIVADNASTDDSVAYLKKHFPQVKQILLSTNTGYAGGYQAALKQIETDYYVLLNSDIEVSPGWLEPIVSMMEQHKNIAAVQPKILDYKNKTKFEYAGAAGGYIDFLGYPFCRGRIFDAVENDNHQYNDNQKIFWASGACLFVRADAFWEVGGLDADFFAHQEEIDLCWRLQRNGYEVWYCGNSIVYHVGGGSLAYANPRKAFLNFRNNLMMLAKNLSFSQLVWIIPIRLILDGLAALQSVLKHKNFKELFAILKAHFAFYASINAIAKKRVTLKIPYRIPATIYPKSILIQYFIRKVNKYSELQG